MDVHSETESKDPHLYPEGHVTSSQASPIDLLYSLWRGKWFILVVVCLFGGTAYVYYQHQPHQYRTSTALLLEEPERPKRMTEFLPTSSQNRLSRELYFLRHSQVFARDVARRLREQKHLPPASGSRLLYTRTNTLRSTDSLAARFQRAVSVRRDGQDIPALRIRVTSSHPREAAVVANTWAEVYRDHLQQANSARRRSTRRFLQQQKEKLHDELRSLEDSIARRVRAGGRRGMLSPSDSGAGIVGTARQLADKIATLRRQKEKLSLELNMEEALLDSAEARIQRIRPNLADRAASTTSRQLRQTHEKRSRLRRDLQTIRARNTTLTPEMQAQVDQMESRLRTLRERADRLAQTYVDQSLSADAINPLGGEEGGTLAPIIDLRQQITGHRLNITRLSARLKVVNDRLASRRAALEASPDQTLARLRRRKNTTKELFVSLSKNLQRAQVAEEATPEQARIIDRASPPITPIAPNIWRNVLLAILLGGMGSFGLVLFYDWVDDVIEEPDDLVPPTEDLFGTIPPWEPDGSSLANGNAQAWPGVAPSLSPAAEAYRHIATNIRLGLPDPVETALVTSPGAQEGKTTTVANLGATLAEAGKNVLLVDADLRGPTLHHLFDVDRRPGLTDRFAGADGGIQILDVTPPSVQGDGAPGGPPVLTASNESLHQTQQARWGRLGLLSAGTEVPQPALLLQEEHIEDLCRAFSASWDFVLFDTPPALLYDDVFRIAAGADFVLLLAASGETHRRAFQDVQSRLRQVCHHEVAPVLNQHPAPISTSYEYYSYPSTSRTDDRTARLTQRISRGVRRIVKG